MSGPVHKARYDVRAGAAVSLSRYEIQLAWVKATPRTVYPAHVVDDGEAVVLSATCYF